MKPVVISGPSGVGKSYIVNSLSLTEKFQRVVPMTTRQPRSGEECGVMYNFLSAEEYAQQDLSGQLFMSNQFLGAKYGMSHRDVLRVFELGKVPVTEMYVPLVHQFINAFPESITLFLMPSSLSFIEERMYRRGDDPSKIEERLVSARKEIDYFRETGYKFYKRVFEISSDNMAQEVAFEIQQEFSENQEFKLYTK